MNIKSLLLASLALAMAGCCGSANNECTAAPKKNIAVQMYSVRDDLKKDYDGTVKKLGEMGFTAVEAAGYGNGKFYGKTPAEFKKSIEDNGMVVLSTHVVKTLSPKELESGDFSESMKWWDECIAAHKAAGAKYIVMPWMPVPKTLKDLKTYCNYFNEVGKKCKEAGMLFGYHNHAHEYQKIEDKVMYDYMLENTNPDLVFFEMDVYWTARGHKAPVDYFKKYPKRFKLLHIKDECELGESGMVGFDAIFNHAKEAGLEYPVVEVERYNFAPIVSTQKSIDYLRKAPFVKKSYPVK